MRDIIKPLKGKVITIFFNSEVGLPNAFNFLFVDHDNSFILLEEPDGERKYLNKLSTNISHICIADKENTTKFKEYQDKHKKNKNFKGDSFVLSESKTPSWIG